MTSANGNPKMGLTCIISETPARNGMLLAWGLSFYLFPFLCQRFFSPKRDACRDRARNEIAHFPGRSDQQAKFADDQMRLFDVRRSGCFRHGFATLLSL